MRARGPAVNRQLRYIPGSRLAVSRDVPLKIKSSLLQTVSVISRSCAWGSGGTSVLSCSQPLAEAHTRITTGSAVELPDYFLRISDDVNMTALDFPRLSTAACGAQRRRSWPAKARLFLRSWDNSWDSTRVLRFARGVHQGRTEACQRVDRRRQTLSLVTRKV